MDKTAGVNKNFFVYDIFNGKNIRKIDKDEVDDEDSDAFDVDSNSHFFVFAKGSALQFRSLKIPD